MFSKLSRYRRVPDVAVPDAQGRVLAAKDIRPLPEVTGTFTHIVDAGDRLDQLAFTYYGQPLQYWHICDANPQFLSPLALLDKEPVVTTRFPLTAPAGSPPWAALLEALSAAVGVQDVTVVEDVALVSQQQAVGGQQVTVTVERFTRAVLVTYNRINIDAPAVAEVITKAGFGVGPPADGGQLGHQIIIPVAVNG
ncbi:MAG TPA: hypothetical protein VFQ48_08570 [Pseudonocardiaceae bacterium]|nr:hypothetical protein [Pseudonocardiaceae bacterium]